MARKPSVAAAKGRARNKKKGEKLLSASQKVGKKSLRNQLSPSRKKQIKGMAQAATSENLQKAGIKAVKSGGQGKVAKKTSLKVTPKSMHKKTVAKDKYYTGGKRAGRK